jgi:hypothetical protein
LKKAESNKRNGETEEDRNASLRRYLMLTSSPSVPPFLLFNRVSCLRRLDDFTTDDERPEKSGEVFLRFDATSLPVQYFESVSNAQDHVVGELCALDLQANRQAFGIGTERY